MGCAVILRWRMHEERGRETGIDDDVTVHEEMRSGSRVLVYR